MINGDKVDVTTDRIFEMIRCPKNDLKSDSIF